MRIFNYLLAHKCVAGPVKNNVNNYKINNFSTFSYFLLYEPTRSESRPLKHGGFANTCAQLISAGRTHKDIPFVQVSLVTTTEITEKSMLTDCLKYTLVYSNLQ